MAHRQQPTDAEEPNPDSKARQAPKISATEQELLEQRVSFAFGLCKKQYDVAELNIAPPTSAAQDRQENPALSEKTNKI